MVSKPIVIGVDGSKESVDAACIGWSLAQAAGVPCRLVHAVPDAWTALVAAQVPTMPDLPERILEDSRAAVRATLQPFLPAHVLDQLDVRIGRAALVLAERGEDAQLIVVGGREHGALARVFGGSTAHYLIRTGNTPVLVTGASRAPVRRVLAAIDLSFAAEPTLAAARDLARTTGARLRVMHVVEPARPVLAPHINESMIYREAVTAFAEYMRGHPEVDPRDRVVQRGIADEAIAAAAINWEADVVVVGSHGKGWVDRLLVGSTTERLLDTRPCAVLVVPVYRAAEAADESARRERVTHPRPLVGDGAVVI
jgi:nucleotide-binding universal stress UspA family protein